ncbi:DUF3197 domain-containing protein [Deinococcus peraridilitoris]|uniref:Uncharacterized protein n=1 Tax=Deinococcus peraridilitoris (strain DSM 19664 / LMG 22246 / CIP 109416 / KR-200) TaxID=937777 RepID=L0A4M4_DEIPD|nr:DUF3197 domain-containing protein [Deinococcus peraridilitoris]AFZ68389.1 Protein of unknown function (DUF3197) [Deinococcus peraridilitoris DSM 19664]
MLIAEPLGVVGAPNETLRILERTFADIDLTGGAITFVTESQGQRANARYGAVIEAAGKTYVIVEAFGGQFGPGGVEGLQALARWAQSSGIQTYRESILSTYDFNRVLREPDEGEIQQLIVSANPSDVNIYLG